MTEKNHVLEKNGEVTTSHVDDAIQKMDAGRKDEILQSFESFKSYLRKRIELAEHIGLNEEQMAVMAEKIGDYLAAHEEPRNSEEKLLQELWKAGRQEERHKLAHMLVRLVQSAN
ncbi:DUF3243 domain-containing protein [Paenibacillus sp. P26]|nr:DUF3243 domain-containing protein [Paenibacillus sp. P26]